MAHPNNRYITGVKILALYHSKPIFKYCDNYYICNSYEGLKDCSIGEAMTVDLEDSEKF